MIAVATVRNFGWKITEREPTMELEGKQALVNDYALIVFSCTWLEKPDIGRLYRAKEKASN
jgi:hypothetical protein